MMKKWILLAIALCFMTLVTGCAVVEEQEVVAEMRPDLYWQKIWIVEERQINIEVEGEDPETLVKMDVYGRVRYEGEDPVNRVRLIIRSPLTFDFIEDHRAMNYGTVYPGDVLEYNLIQNYPEWQERVPIGVYKYHIIDDFRDNAYINIAWEQDDESHSQQFFDWKPKRYDK